MTDISAAIDQVRARIAAACRQAGRQPDSVRLVAVSKTRQTSELREAHAAGIRDFGENYLQEALPKIAALTDCHPCWHFIGPIQSNKTRAIATHFDWVHSVDRLKIAQRLSDQRPDPLPPLDICLQVNVDLEDTKQGVALADVAELAAAMRQLPRLRLRGLMAIPSAHSADHNRAAFLKLATVFASLQSAMPELDTLSMGMSDDFETAIGCGSTLVRIGTALFGPRPQP